MRVPNRPFRASVGSAVRVDIEGACHVLLIEACEYEKRCRNERHIRYGGHYSEAPVYLGIPKAGEWLVLVDSELRLDLVHLICPL